MTRVLSLCAIMLSTACAAVAQPTLDARLQDPGMQSVIEGLLRDSLQAEAGYTTAVRPEMFRIDFNDADCLGFYDEMADRTVGTCLLQVSGWQMYAAYALTFDAFSEGGVAVHPLTIVIE